MEDKHSNNEQEIIKKIAEGDHHAFREIYDCYKDLLYGYSFKLTKSKLMAEEAVQEIFMKVWNNRRKLNPELSIKAYLYKITQNHIYNVLRNAAYNDKLREQIFYHRLNSHFSTEDQVIYNELEAFKDQAIACLPARRQMIFRMSRVQGLSHEEIAGQLGISQHTVKDQIVKSLKSIKEYLKIHADIAVSITLLAQLSW